MIRILLDWIISYWWLTVWISLCKMCRKVKLWSPLRASWRLGHELDHETEIRRKASSLKKQARNSRIRKGIAPKHLYFYHGICVSYRWQFWWSSSFFTAFTWGFSRCSKNIYNRQNITPQGQLYLCACILSKRWTCQVQAHLHVEHTLLWPTPSCILDMAHRSQLLYLTSLDVFTFNCPWNPLEWAL